MKKMFQAAVMTAAVLAVPAMGLAAQAKPATPSAQSKPAATTPAPAKTVKAASAVHSTQGVVKSIDTSSLVISSKAGKKKASHEMKFVLDSTTQKDSNVAVGSSVAVKYHNDAKQHVATEVRAAAAKKS